MMYSSFFVKGVCLLIDQIFSYGSFCDCRLTHLEAYNFGMIIGVGAVLGVGVTFNGGHTHTKFEDHTHFLS